MQIKKIRLNNQQCFIDDIKKATEIMVWVANTGTYLTVTKIDVLEQAESMRIEYYLTTEIFKVGRVVMVIN
jgi:hypothetical protein